MIKDNSIKYFLKFGKKTNIKGIVDGKVWLSTAECLRPLEENLVKGQGDKLEGGMHITATSMRLTSLDSENTAELSGENINLDVLIDPVKTLPIYCLFACYEKDIDEFGNIKLSEDTRNTIVDHFPEADSVAIIKEPYKFLDDFTKSICDTEEMGKVLSCKYDYIHYFHMYGIEVCHNGVKKTVNDAEFINYIKQHLVPYKDGNMSIYVVYADDAWRHLFCKDVFFEKEQEVRLILPTESIKNGKLYSIDVTQDIQIVDLNTFFEKMN